MSCSWLLCRARWLLPTRARHRRSRLCCQHLHPNLARCQIADGTVWGPQSSSHEEPSSDAYAAYNRNNAPQPHWALILLIGYPIIFLVRFICFVPWFASLFMLLSQPFAFDHHDSVRVSLLGLLTLAVSAGISSPVWYETVCRRSSTWLWVSLSNVCLVSTRKDRCATLHSMRSSVAG